jgi:two-component system, OmpR family, sensor histidine kinase KdpD
MESEFSVNVEHFLDMVRSSKRGKLKIYIGMAAGVGKTYRMLLEAHELQKNGINVMVGFVETHNRVETRKITEDLPAIPRKKVFYKGKQLDEMDVEAIIRIRPEVVLADELAHTNIPGSKNEKRWQDVKEILEEGISVITTVNIQHIESLIGKVEKITGVEIKERVPDSIIHMADEVVNVDLTIEELLERFEEGKVYDKAKVPVALNNFFQKDKLLQLRDLALKEVSRQVERKIIKDIPLHNREKINALITCISTNSKSAANIIRKSSRIVAASNSKWYVLYVETPKESVNNIDSKEQRLLINNFKMATELGATVIRKTDKNIAKVIAEVTRENEVEMIVMGMTSFSFYQRIRGNLFTELLNFNAKNNVDILIISNDEKNKK